VPPRRPMCKYAGGAAASGNTYRFKNSCCLLCSGSLPPTSLLSVTIQIQGSPENEPQEILRVKINLHAPGCDVNSRTLGVA